MGLGLVGLVGLASSAFAEPGIYARYVLLSADRSNQPVAIARAIIDPGKHCPKIIGDSLLPMHPRSNPHGFSKQVCEALIPFGQTLMLSFAGKTSTLPTVSAAPGRILTIGDTGCKQSDCPAGSPAQPFATLSASAANKPWDLILHMGDYNYRGTQSSITLPGHSSPEWVYDAGDGTENSENCLQSPGSGFVSQNSPGSQYRDNWDDWNDDFIGASGELLASAPWVFARGNHELCSRAGPGWFYFLGPGSALIPGRPQHSCPVPDSSKNPIDNVVLMQPYSVTFQHLNIVVVDSANACDALASPAMADFTSAYTQQFRALDKSIDPSSTTWLMTHRPLWGIQDYEPGKSTACSTAKQYACQNQTMDYAIENGLAGKLPAAVKLSLAGHMHHFQSLSFPAGSNPPQLVIGTGGVSLADYGPAGRFTIDIGGESVQGRALGKKVVNESGGTTHAYGFLEMTVAPNGRWAGVLNKTDDDLVLAKCSSQLEDQGSVCELLAHPASSSAKH